MTLLAYHARMLLRILGLGGFLWCCAAVAWAQSVNWELLLNDIRPSMVRLEDDAGHRVGMGCVLGRPDFVITTGQTWEIGHRVDAVTHDGLRMKLRVLSYYAARDLVLLQGDDAVARPMPVSVSRSVADDAQLMAVSLLEDDELVLTPGMVTAAENARSGAALILADFSTASGLLGAPVFDAGGGLAGMIAGRRIEIPDNIVVASNEIGYFIDGFRNEQSTMATAPAGVMEIPFGADTKFAESIRAFNRAVLEKNHDVRVYQYQRATLLRPGFFEAWFNLGLAEWGEDNREAALTALETALAIRPDSAAAARALGELAVAMAMWERAETALAQAVAGAPDDSRLRNELGEALVLQGKHDQAAGHFEHALAVSPDYALAVFNLADCYRLLDRKDDAAPLFERYLKLAPQGEFAERARAALGLSTGGNTTGDGS